MALSVILRQCSRVQGASLPNLLRSSLPRGGVITQNYTQVFSQANKNALILNNKKHVFKIIKPFKRNMSADHSKLWPIEKLISVILLGAMPAAFIAPNPVLDNVLAVCIVLHFHWGLEACVVDYVRPIIVGNILPKLALLTLYVVSATTMGGLLYFNYCDVGIGKAIRRLWEVKS